MDIKYKNGLRTTPLVHELSPLDAAINRYSELANAYYAELNTKAPATSEARAIREAKLKEAHTHLEHERRIAESIVDVQTQLQYYRDQGRAHTTDANSRKILAAETHHPTAMLAKFLRADGRPQPSSRHTAHHIVPGLGKTKNANRARLHIHRFGLRINDPDNGVWIVMHKRDTPHWSMPQARAHSEIHTYNYETWIYQKVSIKRDELAIRHQLNIVGRMLQENRQPPEVTMPPIEGWDGK